MSAIPRTAALLAEVFAAASNDPISIAPVTHAKKIWAP